MMKITTSATTPSIATSTTSFASSRLTQKRSLSHLSGGYFEDLSAVRRVSDQLAAPICASAVAPPEPQASRSTDSKIAPDITQQGPSTSQHSTVTSSSEWYNYGAICREKAMQMLNSAEYHMLQWEKEMLNTRLTTFTSVQRGLSLSNATDNMTAAKKLKSDADTLFERARLADAQLQSATTVQSAPSTLSAVASASGVSDVAARAAGNQVFANPSDIVSTRQKRANAASGSECTPSEYWKKQKPSTAPNPLHQPHDEQSQKTIERKRERNESAEKSRMKATKNSCEMNQRRIYLEMENFTLKRQVKDYKDELDKMLTLLMSPNSNDGFTAKKQDGSRKDDKPTPPGGASLSIGQ